MKKHISFQILLLMTTFFWAQNIERLLYTNEIYTLSNADEYDLGPGLNCIFVDEVSSDIFMNHYVNAVCYLLHDNKIMERKIEYWNPVKDIYILGKFCISTVGNHIRISDGQTDYGLNTGNGICFILKNHNDYVVFAVNENGLPEAIDTNGKIYSNTEVFYFLKNYDKEMYLQNFEYAKKIGLQQAFLNKEVLIWNQTYFSTIKKLKQFWNAKKDLFYKDNNTIQYDNSGNCYNEYFSSGEESSGIFIISPELKLLSSINVNNSSAILSRHIKDNNSTIIYARMKVCYGGNIYYFVSDSIETEVFRIRRTWGEPDFYAMAINGYTDDSYGKYVDKVLLSLSKSELRLLRNTIFALYGVHFKSADLSDYFDKQVWYIDEGKKSGEITLPAHRQKLIEMIQKVER